MNTKDIRGALKARLDAGAIGPAAHWPNVEPENSNRPFFQVSTTGVSREGDGVTGNQVLAEIGQFNVVVVVDQGGGEDAAADYADAVAALFPEGQSIAITGGNIVIFAPTQIRGGFPTDADYRIPVAVRYHALRT